MHQIPIEEVLAEYRKKYAEPKSETEPETESEAEHPLVYCSAKQGANQRAKRGMSSLPRWTFPRIVAAQAVTAVIILTAVVAARLFNPPLFEYIAGILRGQI
jgi:anti-sigma-K factor RskA